MLSEGSEGGSFLASSSFWKLPAILVIFWLKDGSLQSLLSSSLGVLPACLCPSFTHFIRISVFGLWPTLILHDFILTWLHLPRPHFKLKLHSQAQVVRNFNVSFGGDTIQPPARATSSKATLLPRVHCLQGQAYSGLKPLALPQVGTSPKSRPSAELPVGSCDASLAALLNCSSPSAPPCLLIPHGGTPQSAPK